MIGKTTTIRALLKAAGNGLSRLGSNSDAAIIPSKEEASNHQRGRF